MKKISREEFIAKAREVHGDKYDYSKVDYVNNSTKVIIICPEHGEFEQTPANHLYGCGCSKCAYEFNGNTRRLTKDEFITKAREIHGDKYDYSKVNYVNNRTKVLIICPKHGEFEQTPANHLYGCGCSKCAYEFNGNTRRLAKEEFITKAREIHGDKYDYSKVNYVNNNTKILIICPKHGEFEQTPGSHLKGNGCPKCAVETISNIYRLTKDEFITKAREVHGDKYDYSKVNYINAQTKVTITCPEHGDFEQTPGSHLRGYGCPICAGTQLMTKEEFITKAREVHGDKYDYSKVNYVNNRTKALIICHKHGEFEQTPSNHLYGYGCPICAGNQLMNKDEFITKAREVHGDKYDYSKVNYINAQTKVTITCPEHGDFEQRPGTHLFGSGCPSCKESHLEKELRNIFKDNNIDYISYFKPDFLKISKRSHLHIDYFIPSKNIAIECQGIQHYMSVERFGGEKAFEKTKMRDQLKKKLCKKNKIKLIYYTSEEYKKYANYDKRNTVTSVNDLLSLIMSA